MTTICGNTMKNIAILSLLTIGSLTPCLGANISWNVSTGDWSVANNWSPAQKPTSVDTAYVTNAGTVHITTAGETCNVFNVAAQASNVKGTVSLEQGGDMTVLTTAYVGYWSSSVGIITQSSGNLSVKGDLDIGFSKTGTYYLVDGQLSASAENIGGNASGCSGYMYQSGGSNSCTGSSGFRVGGGGAVGHLELSGGLLVTRPPADYFLVGVQSGSDGTVIQTGGTNMVLGANIWSELSLGYLSSATGRYTLASGLLYVTNNTTTTPPISIGKAGLGIFTQSGGVFQVSTPGLVIGYATNGVGTYNLMGGTLVFTNLTNVFTVGSSGQGTLNIGNTTGAGLITQQVGKNSDLVVATTNATSGGTVRGWGSIAMTGNLKNNGQIVADGYGADRTLDLSGFTTVTNQLPNTTSNGWYAVNHGQLALPSGKWTAMQLDFNAASLAKSFCLILEGAGTLNIDSLMAYAGSDPKPYSSAGLCEIALAPADSDLAGSRIQFSDEPASVKYSASGTCSGATLKGKVTNVYGVERPLKDVTLEGRTLGTLDLGVFPEAPLGAFRLEVWGERDGKPISPINELVITRIEKPLYWGKDAPNSPFGGHFLSNARTVKAMKAAGVNWVRLLDTGMECTGWAWLEKKKGNWTFQDDKINNYRAAKIKVLGFLGSTPDWASCSTGLASSQAYLDKMYEPKDLVAFSNYVKVVVTHFKGSIDAYNIWNEPWLEGFWHKSYDPVSRKFDNGTPEEYAALSRAAAASAKACDPSVKLIGINSAPYGSYRMWGQQVFDADGYNCCDEVDYHFYSPTLCGYPDDPAAKAYQHSLEYMKKAPPPFKPVVMSEGNPTRGGNVPPNWIGKDDYTGLYKNTITWESKDDMFDLVDTTCRYVVSHLALNVKRVFLYSDHTYNNLLSAPTFPVLLGGDGYPHPALAAFSHMALLLEDRPFVKVVPLGKDVSAFLFEGRSGSVAVISGRKSGSCALKPVSGVVFTDLFGNPITGEAVYRGFVFYANSLLPVAGLEERLKGGK